MLYDWRWRIKMTAISIGVILFWFGWAVVVGLAHKHFGPEQDMGEVSDATG